MGVKNKKKKEKGEENFDFCEVCKLNHDHGRRHIYFPNHKKSLSLLLSRIQNKLSDLHFFLRNPSLLRPEHASHNCFWCVFCNYDISELQSVFACENAINHLSSSEHLKSVKNFLWKHGGAMDRIDLYGVSKEDLAKWANKCKLLKSTTAISNGGTIGPGTGPSKDIHCEVSSISMDKFEKKSNYSFHSSASNDVLPLQCHTNESNQVCHPEVADVQEPVSATHHSPLPVGIHRNCIPGLGATENSAKHVTVGIENQRIVIGKARTGSLACSSTNTMGHRTASGEGGIQVLQKLTQIPRLFPGNPNDNVHSGAPPPWLEANDDNEINLRIQKTGDLASRSEQSGKSCKLNPKRVGAAWAEKRKIEIEMEKRGELVSSNCDDDWLPNFGRVWQAGTRKESRKEFEKEKQKKFKVDSPSEASVWIQPYISKRMRRDSGESDSVVNSQMEGTQHILQHQMEGTQHILQRLG